MYCLAQPSVFSYILINDVVINFLSLINKIKYLIYAVVVEAFCLLSSDKKSKILHSVDLMV